MTQSTKLGESRLPIHRLKRSRRGDRKASSNSKQEVSGIRIVQIAIEKTTNNVEHGMAKAYPVTHFPTKYTDASGFNVFGAGGIESID
jgi:hypothetical protein